ncbi:MAG: SgcJ/EcaC family oxidoreductase [Thermoanaerobaculaceae bacterium]|nr:SgcJ/EcaC family oxidoreductase [Thermoanaerobaculaceae bacterium]
MRRHLAVCTLVSLVAATLALAQAPPGRPLLVTIDDLPVAGGRLHTDQPERARITADLLAVLARHKVPALGFVVWSQVKDARDTALLEQWLAAGLELGNHTARHSDLGKTDTETYLADVEAGRAGLASLLARHGKTPRFFRYPFLREGETRAKLDTVRAALEQSGQRAVPVTIDDQDWSFEEPWVKARRAGDSTALARTAEEYQLALRLEVLTQTALGDELFGRPVAQVLLLHANEVGAAQWDALFTWLESRGYRFATADEVLADPAVAAPSSFVGTHGPGLWVRIAHDRGREAARTAVTTLLQEQAAAWNRGDLDAFCAVYADDAVFVTPKGITRGRQAVLDRYRTSYPTREAMGTLTLDPVEIREAWGFEPNPLGDAQPSRVHGLSLVAHWKLQKADGTEASGLTLLVFHRQAGRWLIVQDASM